MRKIIKQVLLLSMVSVIFISGGCSLLLKNKRDEESAAAVGYFKENYAKAMDYLSEGKDIEGYRTLYHIKEYDQAAKKLEELLADDGFLQYRAAEAGYTVEFGRYEQDNDIKNGKEPIRWTVLKIYDNKLFLFADKVLDCHMFYSKIDNYYTWARSDMCKWLNGEFLSVAFLEGEREMICTTSVRTYEPYFKENEIVDCKAFLISRDEYYAFRDENMNSDNGIYDKLGTIEVSAYARYRYREAIKDKNSYISSYHYAFRSQGDYGLYFCYTNSDSKKGPSVGENGIVATFCVRPAIWVDIQGE